MNEAQAVQPKDLFHWLTTSDLAQNSATETQGLLRLSRSWPTEDEMNSQHLLWHTKSSGNISSVWAGCRGVPLKEVRDPNGVSPAIMSEHLSE